MKKNRKLFPEEKRVHLILSFWLVGFLSFLCCCSGSEDSTGPETPGNNEIFYVATTGNDSNPGTQEFPWKTIQKAADTLIAGETVMILAGTYPERIFPRNSGSMDKYIGFAANPGDTVIIDGTNVVVPEWGGLFDIMDKSYIRVSGLTIMNALSHPHNLGIQVDQSNHIILEKNCVLRTHDSGIGVWSSNNVTIDHNEVSEACLSGWNECISVGDTDTFEIKGNLVHQSQKEGICSKDGSRNGKILGNLVYGVSSVGIYLDAWDKHTHTIEAYQNVVHDIGEGNGLSLASEMGGLLENISIYNNLVYHNQYLGIDISTNGIASTHPMKTIRIINNSCFDNGWPIWGGGIALDNPDAQDVVIRNNICSQNFYFQIVVAAEVQITAVLVDHNLVYPFRGSEGEITGESAVTEDPEFVNATAADFHLKSNSPAIDRGSGDGAPTLDFDGVSRPQGSGIDIGAFEFKFPVMGR